MDRSDRLASHKMLWQRSEAVRISCGGMSQQLFVQQRLTEEGSGFSRHAQQRLQS